MKTTVYVTANQRCYLFAYIRPNLKLPMARFANFDAMPEWIKEAISVLDIMASDGSELQGVGQASTFRRREQDYRLYDLVVTDWRITCLD